jgi:hypothetical protein
MLDSGWKGLYVRGASSQDMGFYNEDFFETETEDWEKDELEGLRVRMMLDTPE